MTITKELIIPKASSDAVCQLGIRIRHLGFEWLIPSGVSCLKSDWDPSHSLIKESDSDSKIKNESINSTFRRVCGNIQSLIDQKVLNALKNILSDSEGCRFISEYSFKDIIEDFPYILRSNNKNGDDKSKKSNISFYDVIEQRIATVHTLNTLRGYEQFKRYILRRIPDIPAISLNQEYINEFVNRVKSDYRHRNASVIFLYSKMRAVINFGKRSGLIDQRINVEFPRSKYFAKDRNLSIEELSRIYDIFRKNIYGDPCIREPRSFALALFILDIAFQGLAPRDIASLRVGDLKRQTVYIGTNGKRDFLPSGVIEGIEREPHSHIECIIVNTSRQKTGNPVTIVSDLEPIRPIIDLLTDGKNPEEYLLPCFSNMKEYTDSQLQNRLANYFNRSSAYLNRYLKEMDSDVCRHRTRISFYYARHAFCNCVDCLDIPRNLIQSMVGHRTTVLENSYLRPISIRDQALVSRALFKFLSHISTLV